MPDDERNARYIAYADKAGEIVRTMGFAGLGVIWLFKFDYQGRSILPAPALATAGMLIVAALGLDLIHHLLGLLYWHEASDSPKWRKVARGVSFWFSGIKVLTTIAAFGFLLSYLGRGVFVTRDVYLPPLTTQPTTQTANQ